MGEWGQISEKVGAVCACVYVCVCKFCLSESLVFVGHELPNSARKRQPQEPYEVDVHMVLSAAWAFPKILKPLLVSMPEAVYYGEN